MTKLENKNGLLDFGVSGKVLQKEEINYFRDVPCDKDLSLAYWVAYNYNIIPINTLNAGIIGAMLLKWYKEGKIQIHKTKKHLLNFKDNNYSIDFSKTSQIPNEIENKLLIMIKKATGYNNILEAKEFEKWCKKNYYQIQQWFYDIDTYVQEKLETNGIITKKTEERIGIIKNKTIVKNIVSPKMKEDAIKLLGFKKFLTDFSRMPERNYYEVHIWEEYLIFATLLGIAETVEEQFSKLYPKFKEELNLDLAMPVIKNVVTLGYKGYETGKRAATSRNGSHGYSGSSRSSGGGGRSYSSGGRSSGGSSGGGFR